MRAEFGRTSLCWAFLLERLPNYWAYNAGYKLFVIPSVGVNKQEFLGSAKRSGAINALASVMQELGNNNTM